MEAGHLEPRVARLEGELEQLVTTVNSLARSMDNWQRDMGQKIDGLAKDNKTDFGLMAQWAGIVLTLVAMVAAPIAYHFNKSLDALDHKLQKEYALVNDTTRERLDGLKAQFLDVQINGSPLTRDRLSKLETQVAGLSIYQATETTRALDELHQRRLKDAKLQ